MLFRDRNEAAQELVPHLIKYRKERAVLLAVPRGGIPIAYPIAKTYNMPLELLMTKKIGHPLQSEFAIGAVSLEDHIIDEHFDIEENHLQNQVEKIRESLKERYKFFMGDHKPIDLENRVIIIVDDGIATGNTVLSAIKMLRKSKPKKIVVAVPVAPPKVAEKIKKHVDELICLYTPEPFIGVGLHYENFQQVSDDEAKQLLKDANDLEDAA